MPGVWYFLVFLCLRARFQESASLARHHIVCSAFFLCVISRIFCRPSRSLTEVTNLSIDVASQDDGSFTIFYKVPEAVSKAMTLQLSVCGVDLGKPVVMTSLSFDQHELCCRLALF